MALYLVLNLLVMAVLAAWMLLRPAQLNAKNIVITVAILVFFTAIFDSLIVGQGIVAYDLTKTLRIFIGRAPVEDFAYALVAAILIPYLWERHEK